MQARRQRHVHGIDVTARQQGAIPFHGITIELIGPNPRLLEIAARNCNEMESFTQGADSWQNGSPGNLRHPHDTDAHWNPIAQA
jgi:hypothetical protein